MPPTLPGDSTPITRIIGAALDLAWLESAGRPLDEEESRLLNLCDDLWHVRADVARPDPHITSQAT
ncbi:hypothetical protein [Acidipropionibacterium virtanenii]|uniref:Uncharacterized protein n=1 Tax=Acidipropionibacterium virtanenii TaxID=2057246 RepID=A0A344UPS8_9ACTN|nr:hypothetical protein [Acidipropionibacterium virtanenii]AXE37276.1 hypothetical protein JS278_00078 [Acidipropionibacterium virtanenii]